MNKKRLNIEIPMELQKKIKEEAGKKNTTLKEYVTRALEEKIFSGFQKKINLSNKFKLAIVCGGVSEERGISLNSARSVADNIEDENIELEVYFVSSEKKIFKIERGQLYSNTTSDFDFKLSNTEALSKIDFIEELKNVSLVFPLIHGAFGEDGELQGILKENNIPFVGSGETACKEGFNKITSSNILRENGFFVFPFMSFPENKKAENRKLIERFFLSNRLKKAVVKPANGGSSIGVFCVYSIEEAIEKVELLFSQGIKDIMLEPFCVGREFTIIVLQNNQNKKPVALLPTEIEMVYENYQIFDYRRKYLPTERIRYYTPARFSTEDIERIRDDAEELFGMFNFKDIIRLDGWLLNNGRIWFSDINIAPGMEQNSFIFQQSSLFGLNHTDLIRYILKSTCNRYNMEFPEKIEFKNKIKNVNVIFGGSNSERQVSLMSGSNVYLKLLKSKKYNAKAFLLDKNDDFWYLPLNCMLKHTVEEVTEECQNSDINNVRTKELIGDIFKKLALEKYTLEVAKKYSLNEFMEISKKENAFVFLGLHGDKGENGELQDIFNKNNLLYNGSDILGSSISMDKYKTAELINNLEDKKLISLNKVKFKLNDFADFKEKDFKKFFDKTKENLNYNNFILKPAQDGSSSGAVRIYTEQEFENYIRILADGENLIIPENTFKNQATIVELPVNRIQDFILEAFIETDDLHIENNQIIHNIIEGWIELTVGVLESKDEYHSLNPSITIAKNKILSVEEKFQGGTGINITPPPAKIISQEQITIIKNNIEKSAEVLKIKNYARLDIFFNIKDNKTILIEANSLPALTPSTVIYHQALTEEKSLNPLAFLEKIIELKSE